MANTKISQLPVYTGSAADIRWFVMNNSDETTTYKYSGYTGLLIPGTGVDSIVSSSALTPTYGPNPISSGLASIAIGSSNTEASANFALALGWNCRATAGGAAAIGVSNNASGDQACVIGYASSAGGVDSFCGGVESNSGGFRSVAIGKYAAATGSESVSIGNAISSEASYGTTIGGIQLIRNSQYSSIVGGRNQTIITNTSYNNIFGASDSDIRTDNGSGGLNTIIGGKGNYISGATSGTTLINTSGLTSVRTGDIVINSLGNTITGTGEYKISIGGFGNTISGSGAFGTIIGGQSNTNSAAGSDIIGGQSNTLSTSNSVIVNGISSTISGSGGVSGIYSSQNSTINADGTYNIIIGGFGNTINGSSAAFSSIIGSYNSSLVDRNNSVMLGTSGRTGTSDYTTYVENIHAYRTPSTQVQPISSGTTFTCNLNNGAKSQFYITGTSTINITNVRDGASFMIKTQTNGNYVMTWTATGGYTFVFEGGVKDPGNNVTDIFVFEVFGSVIYGNRRHNYS